MEMKEAYKTIERNVQKVEALIHKGKYIIFSLQNYPLVVYIKDPVHLVGGIYLTAVDKTCRISIVLISIIIISVKSQNLKTNKLS